MPETARSFDGTRIAYVVQGSGPAVLLLHGFGADHVLNWVRPGVIDALTSAGRRRHRHRRPRPWRLGQPPPTGTAAARWCAMRRAVLDQLGVGQVDVVGYSMGSMVAAPRSQEPRTRARSRRGGATVMPPKRGPPRNRDRAPGRRSGVDRERRREGLPRVRRFHRRRPSRSPP